MIQKTLSTIVRLRVIHYLLSGGLAFLAEYMGFLLLVYVLHIHPVVGNTVSFTLGFMISFTLNKFWVFAGSQNKKTSHQLGVYLLVALFNLLTTNTLIYASAQASIPPFAVKVLLMGMVAAWNFMVFKKIIFKSGTNQ